MCLTHNDQQVSQRIFTSQQEMGWKLAFSNHINYVLSCAVIVLGEGSQNELINQEVPIFVQFFFALLVQ